ncbi:MAG: hypothetical protein JNM24_04840 [Bdellovibrionaceae bacterium]|nr:hypothetical protein [Pseudobdellovibrionaceae bacterium]
MLRLGISLFVIFFLFGCHKSSDSTENQSKPNENASPNSEISNKIPEPKTEREPLDNQSICRLKAIATISLEILVQIEKKSYRTGVSSEFYRKELSECHEKNYHCFYDRLNRIEGIALHRQEVLVYNHSPSSNYYTQEFESCGQKSFGCKTHTLAKMNSALLANMELDINGYSALAKPFYESIETCNYDVSCLLNLNGKMAISMLQIKMNEARGSYSDQEIPSVTKYNACDSLKND